jgi:hypothetical protein
MHTCKTTLGYFGIGREIEFSGKKKNDRETEIKKVNEKNKERNTGIAERNRCKERRMRKKEY